MEDALAALRDVDAGEVTLAANTTIGVYLLPPIVARFHARYPQVSLNISILNSGEILEQTLNWNLDFGLVEIDPSALPPGLRMEVLDHDRLVLVVAPHHHWRGKQVLRPEELQDDELVLREQGSGIREVIEHALLQHDVQVHPLLTVPDNEAIKQMVMNGVGAAIVPARTVQRELAVGDLLYIPIDGLDLRPELSLICRTDKQLSRAAQAFCDLLRAKKGDEQYLSATTP
jgi:DNA-binding transcriptional LysR family regulator